MKKYSYVGQKATVLCKNKRTICQVLDGPDYGQRFVITPRGDALINHKGIVTGIDPLIPGNTLVGVE